MGAREPAHPFPEQHRMSPAPPLQFKIASRPAEFEQIHRLNYRIFVEEIPQHEPNADGTLIDRFNAENTYVVGLRGGMLVGMIALREARPFSLDSKLPDLDSYLPPHRAVCEIRLLAVEPEQRTGIVFRGLVQCLAHHCLAAGYDLAVISGTERQLRLYRHLGFEHFGPPVGTAEARYQPMYLTLDRFCERGRAFTQRTAAPANFLPGPVETTPEVRRALAAVPVSHRGSAFARDAAEVRGAISRLTGARCVQLLLGSGTLANDVVSAQLSLLGAPGVVLSNGEFGERLADHAGRWNLPCAVVRRPWGGTFSRKAVEAALDREPRPRWLWAVHCETSTGVLNRLPMLRDVCAARGVRLCLDCISSLGTVPVLLDEVYLATSTSGKGLGSVPGLSLVLHNHDIAPAPSLPRYLDLGLYAAAGVPFTQSSNLVRALHAAVSRLLAPEHDAETVVRDAMKLRTRLRSFGFRIVAADADASPAVTTVALPPRVDSIAVGERLEEEGYLLSYRSEYLRARNWTQVCLMGCYPRHRLMPLAEALHRASARE